MTDAPNKMCGYEWPHDDGDVDGDESWVNSESTCIRESLPNSDRCVWHTNPEPSNLDQSYTQETDTLAQSRDRAVRTESDLMFAMTDPDEPGQVLDGANLAGIKLKDGISFENIRLRSANFNNAELSKTNFDGATLTGSDFSEAKLTDVSFIEGTVANANLSQAEVKRGRFRQTDFSGTKMREVTFNESSLSSTVFTDANIERACFEDANLPDSEFISSNLSDATFINVELPRADLTRSVLRKIDLTDIKGEKARFKHVDLQQATFSEVELQEADLTDADLRDSSVEKTDFNKANLTKVNLRNATLSDVTLTNTTLSELEIDRTTTIKSITKPPKQGIIRRALNRISIQGVRETIPTRRPERPSKQEIKERISSVRQRTLGRDKSDQNPDELYEWDGVARACHKLKEEFNESGCIGRARQFHVEERRARRHEAKIENGLANSQYWRLTLLGLVTGYGIRLRRILSSIIFIFIISTAAYYFAGVRQGLLYSIITFTTSPPGQTPYDYPIFIRFIAGLETFVGTLLIVLLGFVLGNRERF